MSNSLLPIPVLMLVTGRECIAGADPSLERLTQIILQAVEGGVNAIQLREKDLSTNALLKLATQLRPVIAPTIPILINMTPTHPTIHPSFHPPIHLPEQAPLPTNPTIPFGRSIHSVETARRAEAEGASYLVAGTIFPTNSHPGGEVKGFSFLEDVCRSVPIPVIAIGGILPETVCACMEQGAAGVAVRSPILGAANPTGVARQYKTALNDFARARNHVRSSRVEPHQFSEVLPLDS